MGNKRAAGASPLLRTAPAVGNGSVNHRVHDEMMSEMKKLSTLLMLLVVSAFALGCGDTDTTDTPPTTTPPAGDAGTPPPGGAGDAGSGTDAGTEP